MDPNTTPQKHLSSKDAETPSKSPTPRKFVIQAVETASRKSRKFAPEPVETTKKSVRKFASEPVETTSKSTRQVTTEEGEVSPTKTRRFAPEPLESSARSTRKLIPEPPETSTKTTRKVAAEPAEPAHTQVEGAQNSPPEEEMPIKPRQFETPFWKKVQQKLDKQRLEEEARATAEPTAAELRQAEQDSFWEKIEKNMGTPGSAPNERPSTPSAPVETPAPTAFKPLSFWDKVSKNMDASAVPAVKPSTGFTPTSFWGKVSSNMDDVSEGSSDSGVADLGTKSTSTFAPTSFWSKVSKNLETSPDSGVGDLQDPEPQQKSFTPMSFWSKVQKNIPPVPEADEDDEQRGRTVSQSSNGPRRRFAPQVISTSKRSYRKSWIDDEEDDIPLLPHERRVQAASFSNSPGSSPARRRFAPQLIETAKRKHRSGDKSPAVGLHDKTNAAPSSSIDRGSMTPENTLSAIPSHIAELLNKSNQSPPRKRYPSRRNTRGHSFKVPELDSIDSSESEGETATPSLSHSQSQSDLSEMSVEQHNFKHATRIRESVDDRFSGYLLELAARAAEKQLREQAAAAFVNSDVHEPVQHYVDDDSGESDDEAEVLAPSASNVQTRGQSLVQNFKMQALTRNHRQRNDSEEEVIALQELQKHAEHLNAMKNGAKGNATDGQDPWAGANALKKAQAALNIQNSETRQMRKAASPPMLGGDIDFPRCASPDNARFDVTQGSDALRNSMCALTQQANEKGGLWGPSKPAERKSRQPTTTKKTGLFSAGPSRQASGTANNNGLWGGFCTTFDTKLSPMPTGLITPMYTPAKEKDDPFASFSVTSTTSSTAVAGTAGRRPGKAVPPSPKPTMMALATEKLELEAKIDGEFTDEFVTQVYNYLSLGYPSVARKFDDELSRISRVDVAELRQDDKLAEAKGYVRLGEDEVTARETGIDESMCARWRALRLYVREWGRQQTSFAGPGPEDPHRAWGVVNRRGSWGL